MAQTSSQDDGIGSPKFTTEGGVGSLHTPNTIPFWGSTFTYDGVTYPYTMVGSSPYTTTSSTSVPMVVIPLKFVFADGQSLDGTEYLNATLASPIFQAARYSSGTTQFGDAIERAEFWDSVGHNGWHVLLNPSVLPTQTINVPSNQALDYVGSHSHKLLALMSYSWFSARLKNLIGQLHISPTTVPVFIPYNVFLYIGSTSNCCVLGYHGASSSVNGNGAQQVQTYMFASWTDPGIFRAAGIQDIHALSHEVSEWLNDPFIQNVVPPWQTPSAPQYGCTSYLETGDPIVGSAYPVTVNNYTYHPQNEALLQWFARVSPSDAIHGAYSYPDTTVLTSPATGCQ